MLGPVGKVDRLAFLAAKKAVITRMSRMGPPGSVPIREIRGSSFCPFGCGAAALGSLRRNTSRSDVFSVFSSASVASVPDRMRLTGDGLGSADASFAAFPAAYPPERGLAALRYAAGVVG